jgi:PAS domain S-box-containing protein
MGTPWTLVVESPRGRALAPVQAMVEQLAGLTVLLLLLGGAATWVLTGRLTTPLAELAGAAAGLTSGDYTRRVTVRRRDEVGALATTFNAMAESVANARDRLAAHAQEIEKQAATLATQATELSLANNELSDSVEEAVRARDALDAALHAHAQIAAELDAALASAPVGFAFYDSSLRFRRVNGTLAAFTGLPAEAHVGRTIDEVMPSVASEIGRHMRHVLTTGECVFDVEFCGDTAAQPGVVRHWNTTYYPIRAGDGGFLGVGAVLSDQTAYKELEHQLRHAQKMEAVGRLAGGVAHDFNNILTAITNYSHFLLEDLEPADARRNDVSEISKAADRATTLVRQLLAFSRQQVLQPRALDLNATVRDLAPMLSRLIGAQVHLDTRLIEGLGVVHADPGQIEQVLVNLVVNASDAMPEGGTLTIETANAQLDADYVQQHADAVAGPYVVLAVSDTGSGMSRETQARIFDPFFTTKELGKGTGLGLATVYGIVKQSGGNVWVYSEPGQGTRFKIYLPRAATDVDDDGEQPLPSRPLIGGAETVLLVEDNDAIRIVARRTLVRCGYAVLEASNGLEALARHGGTGGRIDLLVTDLVMPEMGGRDLASRLRDRYPTTRVLYMSGFTHDTALRQSVLQATDFFLEKPFTPDALARKVREVLAPAATGDKAA